MAAFVPELEDVYLTQAILHRQLGLPSELVHAILEEARYWIENSDGEDDADTGLTIHVVTSSDRGYPAMTPVLVTKSSHSPSSFPGEPKLQIREIEFTIVSYGAGLPSISKASGPI